MTKEATGIKKVSGCLAKGWLYSLYCITAFFILCGVGLVCDSSNPPRPKPKPAVVKDAGQKPKAPKPVAALKPKPKPVAVKPKSEYEKLNAIPVEKRTPAESLASVHYGLGQEPRSGVLARAKAVMAYLPERCRQDPETVLNSIAEVYQILEIEYPGEYAMLRIAEDFKTILEATPQPHTMKDIEIMYVTAARINHQ